MYLFVLASTDLAFRRQSVSNTDAHAGASGDPRMLDRRLRCDPTFPLFIGSLSSTFGVMPVSTPVVPSIIPFNSLV